MILWHLPTPTKIKKKSKTKTKTNKKTTEELPLRLY
jgi:hypothetical protein